MPITFNCPCGKVLRIADEHAGKRIKCPACQALGTAPKAAPQFEVVEDEPKEQLAPAPAKAKPVAKPVAKPAARDDDDDAGFTLEEDEKPKKKPARSKGSRRDEDEDEEDERPRRKKRRREDDDDEDYRPRRRPANSNAGKRIMYLIGGVLLVGGGIALAFIGWQGTGRSATRAMVFGAALAIGGFLTAVKGITGNFDDE